MVADFFSLAGLLLFCIVSLRFMKRLALSMLFMSFYSFDNYSRVIVF